VKPSEAEAIVILVGVAGAAYVIWRGYKGVGNGVSSVVDGVSTLATKAKEAVVSAAETVKETATETATTVADAPSHWYRTLSAAGSDAVDTVTTTAKSIAADPLTVTAQKYVPTPANYLSTVWDFAWGFNPVQWIGDKLINYWDQTSKPTTGASK
jgi:hypothetical protein